MIEDAEDSVYVVSNRAVTKATVVPAVEKAWQIALRRAREDGIDVRTLVDLGTDTEGRVPLEAPGAGDAQLRDVSAEETVHFVLADERHLMMRVRPAPLGTPGKRDDVAVWTDAPGSVLAHRLLFERLWPEGEPVKPPG